MLTKTIKKNIGLALVLAVCSASSMASETKVLTPAQYQPTIVAGYGLAEGIVVTGTTLVGCGTATPLYILLSAMDIIPATDDSKRFDTHAHAVAMDILTKAKAAGRNIKVTYTPFSGGSSNCTFESITMQ